MAHEVNDVAILPLGAIEQHGPHCPNGLDSFNAICLAKKVAEKSGATVLPCPMYGGHPYMHMGMPGTITLNYETNMALLHDIIASASNVGYNKFIMLVAHGADSSFIPAVHKLGMEGYFVLASTWYDFLRDNKNVLEDFMWHADEAETSMALSLYGDLVHMDLAIDGGGTPLVDPKWKMAPGEASHRWQFYGAEGTFALLEKDDLDYGVIGNPTKATKEKGDKYEAACVYYLKNDPFYALFFSRVGTIAQALEWDDCPVHDTQDNGIDLMAQTAEAGNGGQSNASAMTARKTSPRASATPSSPMRHLSTASTP